MTGAAKKGSNRHLPSCRVYSWSRQRKCCRKPLKIQPPVSICQQGNNRKCRHLVVCADTKRRNGMINGQTKILESPRTDT